MNKNIYKPRYKITFLSKSKVWSYKDSRLRRFFNIRGRKLVRRGLFKRYVLVFNNMKWTIARRYIRPYMRRRSAVKRRYKIAFYNKQQLRHFYGKFREEAFRNFFKKHLTGVNMRNSSYYSALERRADMFLFRTRLLPTIYAARQFIHHQGIELNGRTEKSSNALVRPGSLLSFSSKYWNTFADLLEDRIYFRLYGIEVWEKRAFTRLKKKVRWLARLNRRKIKKDFILIKKLIFLRKKIKPQFKCFVQNYLNKITLWEIKRFNKIKEIQSNANFLKDLDVFITGISDIRSEIALLWEELNKLKLNFLNSRKTAIKNNIKWKKSNIVSSLNTWKLSQAKFFSLLSTIISLYRRIILVFSRAKLLELEYKLSFIKNCLNAEIYFSEEEKLITKSLLEKSYVHILKKKQYLEVKTKLTLNKIQKIVEPIIRRRIRYRRWWSKRDFDSKKKTVKRNALYYFLIYRRFKASKQLSTPRLKSIHWYIPPYIYFDFRTIKAVFLHNPLPEEIQYSFKCSLSKIHSFYRSRGL